MNRTIKWQAAGVAACLTYLYPLSANAVSQAYVEAVKADLAELTTHKFTLPPATHG